MKNIILLLFVFFLMSCEQAGTTSINLYGEEDKLPQELKGMKVYKVFVDGGNYVRVAVLNNQINSLTYPVGKSQQTTILSKETGKLVMVSNIISENDSIIVCRK